MKIPKSKPMIGTVQAPENHQAPITKASVLVPGVWNFSGAWCLDFGVFACTSTLSARSAINLQPLTFNLQPT
jgi:hypothetical protein